MKKILIIILLIFTIVILSINNKTRVLADNTDLPVCYQQGDSRWGSHMNGDGSIASSACGLLSLTNAVNYLTGNFINPIELADYAYSIDAYNRPIAGGGGTWRDLFYHRLADYEEKYGFKVVNSSIWKDVTDPRLKNHLMNGGVSICHVYGHFIAVVEYDKDTNSYMVYDSAASSRRNTYARATWLTEQQLCEGIMEVDWFCLISKSSVRMTTLDGVSNKTNGRAEVELTRSINDSKNILVSGTCLLKDPVVKYYYIACPSNSYEEEYFNHEYPLSFDQRLDIPMIDSADYFVDGHYCGYQGIIDLKEIYKSSGLGTKYIYIFAKTNEGEKVNIAEIKLNLNDEIVNKTYRTFKNGENNQIAVSEALSEEYLDIGKLDLRDVDFCALSSNELKEGTYNLIGEGINKNLLGHMNLTKDEANSLNKVIIPIKDHNYAGSVYLQYLGSTSQNIDECSFERLDNLTYYSDESNDNHKVLIGFNDSAAIYRTEEHHQSIISKDATCIEDGFSHIECLECNHLFKDEILLKKGHHATDYYYNDDKHYKVCDDCYEEYDFENHSLELSINSKKHGYVCKTCGWSGNFESHNYGEDGICKICSFKNPNHKENDNPPTSSTETEVIDNTDIDDTNIQTSKKGCKKNTGLILIELLSFVSLTYIFIKKH